jgi:hypothetical protein
MKDELMSAVLEQLDAERNELAALHPDIYLDLLAGFYLTYDKTAMLAPSSWSYH